MVKRWDTLPTDAFARDTELPFTTILLSVNRLRHSAVHRLRTSAKGVIEMIHSAVKFTRLLRDKLRELQLEELHREFEAKVKAFEIHKNFLEHVLDRELREIAEQRALLDQREKEAINTMVREDDEYKMLIGSRLEQCVQDVFSKDTQPPIEADIGSEDEINVEEEQRPAPDSPREELAAQEVRDLAVPSLVLEALPEGPVEEDTREFEWSTTPEPESLSEGQVAEEHQAPPLAPLQAPPPAPPPVPSPPPPRGISPGEEGGVRTLEVPHEPPILEIPSSHDQPVPHHQAPIQETPVVRRTEPMAPLELPRQVTAEPSKRRS